MRRLYLIGCFPILMVLVLILAISGTLAQSPPSEKDQNQAFKNSGYTKGNEEAIEILHRMSPEEISSLDQKLAKALVDYYDGKYASALPIFLEVAEKVETMDLRFWIGVSAMHKGKIDLAVEKFQSMLAVDPDLHRVRLELAATYFRAKRFDKARLELEHVRVASPPPAVLENIERLLTAIDERTRQLFWNARVFQGILFDDNVSAGPGERELAVVGGMLTLDDASIKFADEASVTDLVGSIIYDFGGRGGLMWNLESSLYNRAYFSASKFNFFLVDVNTGPWWAHQRGILKVPVGYSYLEYGSDRLSQIFHVSPSYEFRLSPDIGLKGSYGFSNTNYYAASNSDLDNTRQRIELLPTVYLKNRNHIFTATAAYETSDADSERFSYDGPILGVSYSTLLPFGTEVYLGYEWYRRDYDDKPLLYDVIREDEQNKILVELNQPFLDYFFAAFSFEYIDNDSNAALYKYDRKTYLINIGAIF